MRSFEPQPDPDALYCDDPTHSVECTCGADPDWGGPMRFTVKYDTGSVESVATLEADDGFYYYDMDRDMSTGPCENRDAVETALMNEIPAVQAVDQQ